MIAFGGLHMVNCTLQRNGIMTTAFEISEIGTLRLPRMVTWKKH